MDLSKIITDAIAFTPAYVGGLPNVDRRIAEAADRAFRNIGAFLADLEEMFPVEFAAATEEAN
jgi:hypothetical protein